MMGNNGQVFKEFQGTRKDFAAAWLSRLVFGALLSYTAYTIHKTAEDSREGRDGVIEIRATLPAMQRSITALEEQGKTFATKLQLEAAEQRVKNEFERQLKTQSKNKVANP